MNKIDIKDLPFEIWLIVIVFVGVLCAWIFG
jgi:hypothetical protein